MFNARQFLDDHFENTGGVLAHCAAAKIATPSQGQVEKWFSRGALTGEWLAVLLVTLETTKGTRVSLRPYIAKQDAGVFG